MSILLVFMTIVLHNCEELSRIKDGPSRQSEGEVFFLKREAGTVFRVELREPPSVFENELIFTDKERFNVVLLVVPSDHVSLHLGKKKGEGQWRIK